MKAGQAALLLALALQHHGCFLEELAEVKREVEQLKAHNQALDKQLRLGWANALCRDEVRLLLQRVRKDCGKTRCLNRKIATAVSEVDPTHQGYFATMMSSQRHEVFYLREQEKTLDPSYRRRLHDLVQAPWLPTTDFLVVSNLASPTAPGRPRSDEPSREEQAAERRGLLLIEEMLRLEFPESDPAKIAKERVIHWVFGFTIKKAERMSMDDLPPPGRELKNSVWVFRVDCAGDPGALKAF